MLTCQLLKNHAGIVLVGDYTTLRSLHEVVHEVNEKSPLIKDKEGSFWRLLTMSVKPMKPSVRLSTP